MAETTLSARRLAASQALASTQEQKREQQGAAVSSGGTLLGALIGLIASGFNPAGAAVGASLGSAVGGTAGQLVSGKPGAATGGQQIAGGISALDRLMQLVQQKPGGKAPVLGDLILSEPGLK